AGLWLRGDHRGVPRAPASGRNTARQRLDGFALSRRRGGADKAQSPGRGNGRFSGHAAVLPARHRRSDPLPAALAWGGLRRQGGVSEIDTLLVVLAATLRAGTPLVFAALGELVTERAGVLNLGIE